MAIQNTPIWLDLKTEYLDANIKRVLEYLSTESRHLETDAFYEQTGTLLKKRVKEIITEIIDTPIGKNKKNDKEVTILKLKILGAYILIQKDKSKDDVKESLFFFINLLIQELPGKYTEDLCDIALKCITQKGIINTGFGWEDLHNVNLEIIAYKLLHATLFNQEYASESWYQGKGSLKMGKGVLDIFEKNKDDSAYNKYVPSLGVFDNVLRVQTSPSDRIIQSESDNFSVMNSFTVGVMREQMKTSPSPDKSLKNYLPGEKIVVKVSRPDSGNGIILETMDQDHIKVKSFIPSWSQVYMTFYTGFDLARYLPNNSYIEVTYSGDENQPFDLTESFLNSMINNTIRIKEEVNAVLKNINPKTNQMMWWTQDGYPAYVRGKDNPGSYFIGDTAYLQINNCASNGFVYATINEASSETVDEVESRKYCVEGFTLEHEPVFAMSPEQSVLGAPFVLGLNRLLFNYQHCLDQAPERYRVLCLCRILSTLTEDSQSLQYVETACDYLRALICFAKDEFDKIRPLDPRGELAVHPSVIRWQSIIKILQAYGKKDTEDLLSSIIHSETTSDPFLIKLAKLIQSSNRIDDILPEIKTVIKGQITKLLSIETANNTNLEDAASINLGLENSRLEFKTSFFYAPEDAYEKNQEKNIFRDLCSFLNTSEGGTLYIGVNDNGGINGIQGDLEYLEKKVIGTYKGIDGYVRYITDRTREYFDLDVRIHFKIASAYEGRVIEIVVEPYEHGVIEFEGVPYIRNNNASVKMSKTLRRQIEAKRVSTDSKQSAKIVAISEAIKDERVVVFHNYASSNSEDVRNRTVEPFAFIGGHAFVWCYDLDDNQNKLFRLSRIKNVEIETNHWTQKDKHQKGQTDIFHFAGEKPIHVKLQLDIMAKNLLLEEYPDSATDLSPLEDNLWLLQTKVFSIVGIGRFYTGLANHITVLDAPELVEYAKSYFEHSLKEL